MSQSETGAYLLLIHLNEICSLTVGALGVIDFSEGIYVYIGSAMGGLDQRISRHLRKKKKIHWHIDYLLELADNIDVLLAPSPIKLECELALIIAAMPSSIAIKGFGCSDCGCNSHLFHISDMDGKYLCSTFPRLKQNGSRILH
ncbi:MAG: GIY-YIG nuclease family protein [Euryarchaeota archaeon]|nr:GIY-YIG nuclease family protein [Euryarchaeota archaeon]